MPHVKTRFCILIALFLFIFILAACPYESRLSLENPQKAKIDGMLLGKWRLLRDKNKPPGVLTIYPFNKHEYLIMANDPKNNNLMIIRAFGTVIDGEKFLNLQDLKSTEVKNNKWLFVNYAITDDRLRYRIVDEKLFQGEFNSPRELIQNIRRNLKQPALYGNTSAEVLQRIYPESKNGLPPSELIRSNFKKASFVMTVRLTDLGIQKTVRADDGSIGYLVTKESGTILRTFKGPLQVGSRITYHDWLEYQPTWKNTREGILLVFLRKDSRTGAFVTTGEASVFQMTSGLNRMILWIAESS